MTYSNDECRNADAVGAKAVKWNRTVRKPTREVLLPIEKEREQIACRVDGRTFKRSGATGSSVPKLGGGTLTRKRQSRPPASGGSAHGA